MSMALRLVGPFSPAMSEGGGRAVADGKGGRTAGGEVEEETGRGKRRRRGHWRRAKTGAGAERSMVPGNAETFISQMAPSLHGQLIKSLVR